MTSKEALEKLEMEYPSEGVILWTQYDIEFAIIEKDLEMLEFIKQCPICPIFDYSKSYDEWCNDVSDTDIVEKYDFTQHKYELLKEWLENE